MSTSSRPRRAAALTALTAGAALLLAAPSAVAAGEKGDVKVHMAGTQSSAHLNQPKVCLFYLDAFNFDVAQGINWTIEPQSAQAGTTATLSGVVTLANGAGVTSNLMLPTGHYKLTWKTTEVPGQVTPPAKHKVFKVDCKDKPGPGGGGPHGGAPAGGGGLAREDAFTTVAGAAAVGLVAVGAATWFRLRRRPHGVA